DWDLLVVGGGLRGLVAALQGLRTGKRVRVLERLPNPGGSTRTLRSEGFVCELGPLAWLPSELAPVLAVLRAPPPLVAVQASARHGFCWDGRGLAPVPVEGEPRTGRGGAENLVTALRTELGAALVLGREVVGLHPGVAGW